MIEWNDARPEVNVAEPEYKRLLGFPIDYKLEGRARELADWARQWYAENGRPWIYARGVELKLTGGDVQIDGSTFTSERLHTQLKEAQADRAALVAVSAGKECEERAQQLWLEGKPDEYFFLEIFGSAVVEHLVTSTGARLCAWAEGNRMAVLPHYSPGYSGWDTADQNRLFETIKVGAKSLPGELRVLESGMLQPKKSLLAVFGITEQLETVRRFANLVPCENCSFSPCQYRRAPYLHAPAQIEDVRRLQPSDRNGAKASAIEGLPLEQNARYSINPRALRKWSQERLQLRTLEDHSVEARFRYEGTTCSNLGRLLAYDYLIKLGGPEEGYRIRATTCAPAPGDTGYAAMCEYINNGETLTATIARECPLLGRPLNDVLMWKRPFSPAACYCDAESRMHKWGLVLEVIHYALAKCESHPRTKLNQDHFMEVGTL
jgi:hypothetical protein